MIGSGLRALKGIVLVLTLCLGVVAAPRTRAEGADAGGLADVPPSACAPREGDHGFLWWAHGWRGRSPDGRRVLAVETGRYGFALDVERLEVLHLGPLDRPGPYEEAVARGNEAVVSLPPARLEARVIAEGRTFRAVGAARDLSDRDAYPVRLVESGRLLRRFDVLQVELAADSGERLDADARLEVVSWPDRLGLLLEVTPRSQLPDGRVELDVGGRDGARASATSEDEGPWPAGRARSAGIAIDPAGSGLAAPEDEPTEVRVEATDLRSGASLEVSADATRAWRRVVLRPESWDPASDPDHLDRVRVVVTNRAAGERAIRLLFAKDHPFPGVTGMTPILRDPAGVPTGIPVQISKNWHAKEGKTFLYQGPWFHGFAMLRAPPGSRTELELTIAYARWGGVPAASHAQLCLIGWGTNQLWDQAAIGSWGESICYDPDVNLERSMIDDVRPLMVWQMNARRVRWGWTNNVGGGDFLVYHDEEGRKQFLTRMRTAYGCQGPNLTRVAYAGVTADGRIAARIEVSTPRTDDLNRAYHRFRYDVLEPAPFRRLAFYQVGADRYNDHQFGKLARGNRDGLVEEWTFEKGGRRYHRKGLPCEGAAPWLSLHEAASRDDRGGAWANRGLVIRSWKARLAGKDAPVPHASTYGTEDGFPSMNVELSPPPGLDRLLPGDFVEGEVELLVVPMSADDYYGPDAALRKALETGGNGWRMVHREAAGNALEVTVRKGRLLRAYPPEVEAAADGGAELEIRGGLGHVPVSFVGLSSPSGWVLRRTSGGTTAEIDQSVHGNDFWQAEHDPRTGTWRLTFNVPAAGEGAGSAPWSLELRRDG